MDRRQQKSRKAIFKAFSHLLEVKSFENITVQDIIDEADVGRSTFYAHFETKDELLRVMCTDIFQHVFAELLPQEMEQNDPFCLRSLELKLAHVLYHLKERSGDLRGIFRSESRTLFMRYFKEHLRELFTNYRGNFKVAAPEGFMLNHLVSSFAAAVVWWISEDTAHSPEEMAAFYIAVVAPYSDRQTAEPCRVSCVDIIDCVHFRNCTRCDKKCCR